MCRSATHRRSESRKAGPQVFACTATPGFGASGTLKPWELCQTPGIPKPAWRCSLRCAKSLGDMSKASALLSLTSVQQEQKSLDWLNIRHNDLFLQGGCFLRKRQVHMSMHSTPFLGSGKYFDQTGPGADRDRGSGPPGPERRRSGWDITPVANAPTVALRCFRDQREKEQDK